MDSTSKPEQDALEANSAVVEVCSYEEVGESYRRRDLSSQVTGPGDEHFHKDTVFRLDGEAHKQRRRAMGRLISRRGHQEFRDKWLIPKSREALAEVLDNPDPEGVPRVDLLGWARRVNQQLAAALVGFDRGTTQEGSKELFDLVEVMMRGRPGGVNVVMHEFDESSPEAIAAIRAKEQIIEQFYVPAMAMRRELLSKVDDGELTEDALPHDLLTAMAQERDPAWADSALAKREAIFLLTAGVHTTSSTMIWTLRELFNWLEDNPDQAELLGDKQFLLRAAEEAMRLHPVVSGHPRVATDDVELAEGTRVPEGAIAMIHSGPANLDSDAFGEHAESFNPFREVPSGHLNFGYAFGAGRHMCYGMPIVMGAEGVDGSLVHLLKLVLDAGVRPDPAASRLDLASTRGKYSDMRGAQDFMVVFPEVAQ